MKEKDTLATLSQQQSNPFLAKPEDFEIVREDDEVFHGQRSDALQRESDKECNRKFSGTQGRPTEASDAGKPKTRGIDGPEGV